MNNHNKITIKSVEFSPMGKYSQQYLRSYNMVLDSHNAMPLEEAYQKINDEYLNDIGVGKIRGGSALSMDLAKETSNVLGLSCDLTPVALVTPNGQGWEGNLTCFVIEMEVESMGMSKRRVVVTGYTDSPMPKDGVSFDPKMVMTINAIHTGREIQFMTPTGMEKKTTLHSTHQVLSNAAYTGMDDLSVKMRPQEIFGTIDKNDLPGLYGNVQTIDLRARYTNMPVLSNYANNVPSFWLEFVMSGYIIGKQQADEFNTPSRKCELASRISAEASGMRDPFMYAIAHVTEGYGASASFTLEDLKKIDPEGFPCIPVHWKHPTEGSSFASWDMGDMVTLAAATIAQSIPAIMAKHGVRSIDFTSNNNDPVTLRVFTIHGAAGIFEFVDDETMVALVDDIHRRVIDVFSHNDAINYTLKGSFDLYGSSMFTLNLNFQGEMSYASPTFANALFTPVLAKEAKILDELAETISQILPR
jgi:hypothetical protein